MGKPGRPSYAAIEFLVSGANRLIAGVRLEKKSEPTVEPTPFIITGLDREVQLQNVLLMVQGTEQAVPELSELRENAARFGGRLQEFSSLRDYFAALFDHGVTALRLGTDEERNKLNEMLRTSMTGGISRTLTSDLRSFLLKEEAGLSDTVQRMKANLNACRRTRTEVQESQRLEKEIGGVFEAGQRMFAAAFFEKREVANERKQLVAIAREKLAAAKNTLMEADAASLRVGQECEAVEAQLSENQQALTEAKEQHKRIKDAVDAAKDVAKHRDDLEMAASEARAQEVHKIAADGARTARRDDVECAQKTFHHAGNGLADLQKGLEEFHRRADGYRWVTRRCKEAEQSLGIESLPITNLDQLQIDCRAKLEELDAERRKGQEELADAKAHRQEHKQVMAAVGLLVGREIATETAYGEAIDALSHHRSQKELAKRIGTIAHDLESARIDAKKQRAAQERAHRLGLQLDGRPMGEQVSTALADAETERAKLKNSEDDARTKLAEVGNALKQANLRRQTLEDQEPEWHKLDGHARQLGAAMAIPIQDRLTLNQARAVVKEKLDIACQREGELKQALDRLHGEARDLRLPGGPFEPELLQLKDELAAELLATSFEDAAIDEAGVLEARLGPLVKALVVEDLTLAKQVIGHRPSSLNSVWLIARDGAITGIGDNVLEANPHQGTRDVFVNEGQAVRITRIPKHPTLGRKAREARAWELDEESAKVEKELDTQRALVRALNRHTEAGDMLLAGFTLWFNGDPAVEIANLVTQNGEREAKAKELRSIATRDAARAQNIEQKIAKLHELLGETLLWDPTDYAAKFATLKIQHELASAADREVTRCAASMALVERKSETLRRPPLSDEDIALLQSRTSNLQHERARWETGLEALEYVNNHRDALAWGDAEAKLDHDNALIPALQQQLDQAKAALLVAQQDLLTAEKQYDSAVAIWQDADGLRRARIQQLDVALARLHDTGILDPTPKALQEAEMAVDALNNEVAKLQPKHHQLLKDTSTRNFECTLAMAAVKEADDKATSEEREAKPAIERWERHHALAAQLGLLSSASTNERFDVQGIRGSAQLGQEAEKQKAMLIERLRASHGGQELLSYLEKDPNVPGAEFAESYLDEWQKVREWLRRRLPAQVAEVDDPLEALLRFRDQLTRLEERLLKQENDLRGESENVARGIEVQVRKARGQVNRLNKHLEGIRFGAIQAIRVRQQSVERMEQVLRALREGDAQSLLFQPDISIEDALMEIFRRYGGGGTGGQRLLDYREYLELHVEIKRLSSLNWENANPTRLSTGEAIGVGAALMMVVLAEWERDANLLRGKKTVGSMRFLFLDEANRLSPDNLSVLFDLCEALELQLLIAAPDIACAERNTTYRLVRTMDKNGHEEVVATGRRMPEEA